METRLHARTRVVGRDDERARLLGSIARLSTGLGGMCLITGVAGVGKSRLVDEAVERARGRSTVLRAQGAEALVEVPFAGLVQALTPLSSSGRWRSLVDGLPRLHALWPSDIPEPAQPPAEGDVERAALLNSVVAVLRRLSAAGPVLLVVDDVHWADRGTLDVLAHLAPVAEAYPLLVLATARTDLTTAGGGLPGEPWMSWSATWPAAERITLGPVSHQDVAVMVRDLLGDDAPTEFLATVADRARGVPLYVRALTFAMVESGDLHHADGRWSLASVIAEETPKPVRSLVLERLALRRDEDREVVCAVAVGCRPVPHDVLSRAVGLPENDLLAALARLTSAGLVVEDVSNEVRYRVEHPLVRGALADSLGEVLRRRLHARMFDALLELHPRSVHEQAQHAVAAGDAVDAARALPVLLSILGSTAALEDAIVLALAARELARRSPDRPGDVVAALELLGQAHESRGERAAAGAAWDEALELADGTGPGVVARVHRRRALLSWDCLEVDAARWHLDQALAVAEPGSQERAAALHTRLLFEDQGADPAAVRDAVDELREFEDEADRPDPVETALGRCWTELNLGRFHTARRAAESALASARAAGDTDAARRAHLELTLVTWMLGDHRALARHAELATAVDERFVDPGLRAQADFRGGIAMIMAGDDRGAARLMRRACADAERAGFARIVVACSGVLAAALALSNEVGEARRGLGRARDAARGAEGSRATLLVEWATGILAVENDDGGAANPTPDGHEGEPVHVVPSNWHHFPPFAVLAARHAYRRADVVALGRVRDSVADSDGPYAVAGARFAAGLASLLHGADEGGELLREAATRFEELELPRDAALARWHAGDVDSLLTARATFRRLGDDRWAARCRSALRAAGVSAATLRDRPTDGGPLTPRELEVARLVAAGRTSAAIAGELGVSVRTVTSHLEHIYRRLDLPSRTALATWLHSYESDPLSAGR
jgi:DNA-binding CsgD family transcriptional regulator/tetratricopeptide (TPR) repeat protein